jgi:hypothetical protein
LLDFVRAILELSIAGLTIGLTLWRRLGRI